MSLVMEEAKQFWLAMKRKRTKQSQSTLMNFFGNFGTKEEVFAPRKERRETDAASLFIPELKVEKRPKIEQEITKTLPAKPISEPSTPEQKDTAFLSSDPHMGFSGVHPPENFVEKFSCSPVSEAAPTLPESPAKILSNQHQGPVSPKKEIAIESLGPFTRKEKAMNGNLKRAAAPAENKSNFSIATRKSKYPWLRNRRDAQKRTPNHPDYDPTTLYIPPADYERLSDFEKQYWGIKKEHMQTIIFFKKGKFYEIYEDDSELTNKLFDLKCTDSRNMRMTGVPHTHGEYWAAKLLAKGYKVGIVDQTETSAAHSRKADKDKGRKGVLSRELKRVLTAGTVTDPLLIGSSEQVPLLSLYETGNEGDEIGVCILEAAEANVYLTTLSDDTMRTRLDSLLLTLRPKEVVFPRGKVSGVTQKLLRKCISDPLRVALPSGDYPATLHECTDRLYHLFESNSSEILEQKLKEPDNSTMALCGLAKYLESLKVADKLLPICVVRDVIPKFPHMVIDGSTLEQVQIHSEEKVGTNSRGKQRKKRGSGDANSLVELLNYCSTDFGYRQLREWVKHPLTDVAEISRRHCAVDDILTRTSEFLDSVIPMLKELPDLSRSLCRILSKTISIPHLQDAMNGFNLLLRIVGNVLQTGVTSPMLKDCCDLGKLQPAMEDLSRWFLNGDPSEKFDIPQGYDTAYDTFSANLEEMKSTLEMHRRSMEASLGISLKYKDIGKERYQLEAPARTKLTGDVIMKSRTKTVVRFWTPLIQSTLLRLIDMEDKVLEKKNNIFNDILDNIALHYAILRKSVDKIATLDCIISLAIASETLVESGPVCKPEFVNEKCLNFGKLRHPYSNIENFIPNDTVIRAGQPLLVLTGPNMGGKTTLLRQICVGVIMAQVGCYVPAETCKLSVVDKLFTRIGSSDDIISGRSTFLVEMQETAHVLNSATPDSLVLLDELGRGTATFDGHAIAGAVLDHVRENASRTIVSTHYHLLAEELSLKADVATAHMGYDEEHSLFLYTLLDGICPKSHGMVVAKLCGIEDSIIENASEVAETFETSKKITNVKGQVLRKSLAETLESIEYAILNGRMGVLGMLQERIKC